MARTPKAQGILPHEQVWSALDRLAERAGLSASGLAKKSGLDPTTFNKSKRITSDGRERWPSTESLSKALAATNSGLSTFVQFIDDGGCLVGKGWDQVGLPTINDEHAYALEISGDSMKPAYRDGDVIVVSPGTPIRRGDRVVVKTSDGEVMVKELKRRTAKTLELQSLNPNPADRPLAAGAVERIAQTGWETTY